MPFWALPNVSPAAKCQKAVESQGSTSKVFWTPLKGYYGGFDNKIPLRSRMGVVFHNKVPFKGTMGVF